MACQVLLLLLFWCGFFLNPDDDVHAEQKVLRSLDIFLRIVSAAALIAHYSLYSVPFCQQPGPDLDARALALFHH